MLSPTLAVLFQTGLVRASDTLVPAGTTILDFAAVLLGCGELCEPGCCAVCAADAKALSNIASMSRRMASSFNSHLTVSQIRLMPNRPRFRDCVVSLSMNHSLKCRGSRGKLRIQPGRAHPIGASRTSRREPARSLEGIARHDWCRSVPRADTGIAFPARLPSQKFWFSSERRGVSNPASALTRICSRSKRTGSSRPWL